MTVRLGIGLRSTTRRNRHLSTTLSQKKQISGILFPQMTAAMRRMGESHGNKEDCIEEERRKESCSGEKGSGKEIRCEEGTGQENGRKEGRKEGCGQESRKQEDCVEEVRCQEDCLVLSRVPLGSWITERIWRR